MKKIEIEICKEIISLFNKASFNVSGIELIQSANKLTTFARIITDAEKELNNPVPIPIVEKAEIKKGKR